MHCFISFENPGDTYFQCKTHTLYQSTLRKGERSQKQKHINQWYAFKSYFMR